jgi:hypothetical protein
VAALQLPNVVIKDALRFAQDQLSPIIGAQRRLRNANESSGRSLRPKRPALSFEELLLAASGDGGGDGGEMVASIEDSRSGGGGGFFSSLFSSRGRKEASASSSSPMCIGGIASRSVSGRELLAAAREMAEALDGGVSYVLFAALSKMFRLLWMSRRTISGSTH